MGPEHSSARPERFLQLIEEDPDFMPTDDNHLAMNQLQEINMIVCNPTTPANYMHMLRRQIKLPFRKPLIVMTPKALLRLPAAQSNFEEMLPGTSFSRAYKETGAAADDPALVKKIVFCSGKVYYDLINERKSMNLDEQIAIVRIEQVSQSYESLQKKKQNKFYYCFANRFLIVCLKIAPFPFDIIKDEMTKYKNAKICFSQEEHKNAGVYEYVRARLQTILKSMEDPRVNQIRLLLYTSFLYPSPSPSPPFPSF